MNFDQILQNISNVSGNAWLMLIGTLGGAIIGGFMTILGAFITNRSNYKNLITQLEKTESAEKTKRILDRKEDLFLIMSHAIASTNFKTLLMVSTASGKISYDQYLDQSISSQKKDIDFFKIDMIITLYFPSTNDEYIKLKSVRNKIDDAFKPMRVKNITIPNLDIINTLTNLQRDFNDAEDAFFKKLRNI